MRYFIFFLLLTFSIFSFSQNNLRVQVTNIESNQGKVVLLLFKKGQDFGIDKKAYKVFRKDSNTQKVSFVIDNLPLGEYAFLVYHDANNNAKLDTNWLGMPKEGIGKSGKQGKRPNYINSKFQFTNKPKEIYIKLKYIF